MEKKELVEVHGGVNVNGATITALVRGMQMIFNIGRHLGSSMRRARSGRLCPVR